MKITSSLQFEQLVSEMEKSPAYAKGFRKGSKPANFDDFWNEISQTLNSLGPPTRNADGWHKVWKDLKYKVKIKMVHNKAKARLSGGDVSEKLILSPLEESVANLLEFGRETSSESNAAARAEHDPMVTIVKSEDNSNEASRFEETINGDVQTINANEQHQAKQTTSLSENELIVPLKKQIEMQQKQCEHLNALREFMNEISQYQRQRFDIEKERLNIYKRKAAREEELLELEIVIKKKQLELIEKQLNANN